MLGTVLRPKQFDPVTNPLVMRAEPFFQYVVSGDCNNIECAAQDGLFNITVEDAWRGGPEPTHASITLSTEDAVRFARWILTAAAKASA